MRSVNPVLPETGFAVDRLLPPRQAIVAFLSRVTIAPPATELVSLDESFGRVLAQPVVADADYPVAARSLMDGFAVRAEAAPGAFEIAEDVRMGCAPTHAIAGGLASRIPTGGILPQGADAVVPVEETRVARGRVIVERPVAAGENVVERGADMHLGEPVLAPGRRIRAPEVGVLAALGHTSVAVYRRPVVAVFSSGDELIDPAETPQQGQIRDSNRHAVAASLRAMGAVPRHYPTLRDEAPEFESAIAAALAQCDAVVVTGGSSVGARDRLPRAVAEIADPGIVVHGLRVKPGKPTLLGAHGNKPIIGLPGNPTSALMILEGVATPIVAALVGAPIEVHQRQARLGAAARSRNGWTWYVPVRLEADGGLPRAYPLELRSFSVSLTARADGYVVMDERDDEWAANTPVSVHEFLGGA